MDTCDPTDSNADPTTGCVITDRPAGAPCDDEVSCTQNDQCDGSGTCAGTPNDTLCDDGNQCTAESCDPELDCQSQAVEDGTFCDDDNACTTNDTCQGGTCAGGDSLDCDDGNICTDDSCDPDSGCVHTNNTAPCDDGDACTTNDTCQDGTCVGGPPPDCDDGNICTDDSCEPASGCVHTNNTAPCDDGDACTTNDTCQDGTCVGGPPPDCDDENVCTDDSCDPASGCVHTNNTASCDDSFACTTGDQCDGGQCVGTPDNTACDDGASCTTDTCDPDDPNADGQGCVFTPNDASCDDGATCTQDVCDPDDPGADSNGCVITPDDTVCDDGNVCTDNTCNPNDPVADGTTGCVDSFNTDPCDDGIPCTTGDVCDGGNCAGMPDDALCDDSDECTVDVCDPETGCSNTLVDTDNDGVCDAVEESCLSGSSNDNNQTALPTATGAGCVIVESDCTHSDVEVFRESDLGKDRSFLYLYGLVGFRLTGCPDAGASVKLTFDAATDLSDFVLRKFGPLPPGGAASQFYTLAEENPNANVQVVGNMVTFELQDGEPGDDTGQDGVIVDQAGPGLQDATAPVWDRWAYAAALAFLLALAFFAFRRQLRGNEA